MCANSLSLLILLQTKQQELSAVLPPPLPPGDRSIEEFKAQLKERREANRALLEELRTKRKAIEDRINKALGDSHRRGFDEEL